MTKKSTPIEFDFEKAFDCGYPVDREIKMHSPYEIEYLVARDLWGRGVLWALDLNNTRINKILTLTAIRLKEIHQWRTMKPEASPFG